MKPYIIYIFMGIIVLALVLTNILFYIQNNKTQTKISDFSKITDTLVRSQATIVSKKEIEETLKKYLTTNEITKLKEDLKEMGATLNAVGLTIGKLEKKVAYNQRSDREGKPREEVIVCEKNGRPIDIHGYTKASQIKTLKDKNNADLADVTFDASSKTPWNYEIFDREYYLTTVLGKNKDGSNLYYHSLKYKIPGRHKDKLFNIPILSSSYQQLLKIRQMFWFNPTVDISIDVGGIVYSIDMIKDSWSLGFDAGISLSSYGKTEVDTLWKFFRFGIGYDAIQNSAFLSFSPALYNLGDPMPLITNLYIIPKISFDHRGNLAVTLGISIGL